MVEPLLITTPIYYVNDVPHIGHAYTNMIADVMARIGRLQGRSVFLLTGTDEHGQKVEKTAASKGMKPKEYADNISASFRRLADGLGMEYNDFIRTTEPRHADAVAGLWRKLEEAGALYKGSYGGWYAVRDECFYSEGELVDGLAPTGAPVEWVEEESYFFRLSAYQEPLIAHYTRHPEAIWPASRRHEVMSFLEGGLKDLSISRQRANLSWGIPVPGDADHVIYVWLDALTNYITAMGYPDAEAPSMKLFWPTAQHVVGKDILRFHAVYWPAFLMAVGLPLPSKVVAHGWWTNEGQKISKSLGNVIDPFDLLERFGRDYLRYFMMRDVPFGQDGNYSEASFIQRIHSDLCHTVGNLAQRSLSMVAKHANGVVPAPLAGWASHPAVVAAYEAFDWLQEAAGQHGYHLMLEKIQQVGFQANAMIDHDAPWRTRREDPLQMADCLYRTLEIVRVIAVMLLPWVPSHAHRLLDQLAVPQDERDWKVQIAKRALVSGTALPPPSPVFARVDGGAVGGHATGEPL